MTIIVNKDYGIFMNSERERRLIGGIVRSIRSFERAPDSDLRCFQQQSLSALFHHAETYSPFWRERLIAAKRRSFDNAFCVLQNLPILKREDLQNDYKGTRALSPSWRPGLISSTSTSGSTGKPVRIERYGPIYGPPYIALSVLDALWHNRQQDGRMARIAFGIPDSVHIQNEVSNTNPFTSEAKLSRRFDDRPLISHLEWLMQHRPAFLKISPSVAAQIAELAIEQKVNLSIKQIISQSERVAPQHRLLCKKAFGAEIIDRYSCEETGWIALQCPEFGKLHVVSATTFLEIVDDDDRPVPAGKPGRVLVTSFVSHATPMIRYDIGDLAEWGTCDCGRTWPVIGKLWGRTRHMLRMPDGRRVMAPLIGDDVAKIEAVREFRIIQHRDLSLEIEVVATRPLDESERTAIQNIFVETGFSGLSILVTEKPAIAWPKGPKREEFVCL